MLSPKTHGPSPLRVNLSDDVHNLYCLCIFEKEEEEEEEAKTQGK